MDSYETHKLETSRENWMVTSIVLLVLIGIVVLASVFYTLGRRTAFWDIQASGYSIIHVSTETNSNYIVERSMKR